MGDVLKTGRRKRSTATVRLLPGKGQIIINGKQIDEFFGGRLDLTYKAQLPLKVTDTINSYDVNVKVLGGGTTGQAGAISLGIARALVETDIDLRSILRKEGLLTRDPREVERKKYGHPKARKRFQFSKR